MNRFIAAISLSALMCAALVSPSWGVTNHSWLYSSDQVFGTSTNWSPALDVTDNRLFINNAGVATSPILDDSGIYYAWDLFVGRAGNWDGVFPTSGEGLLTIGSGSLNVKYALHIGDSGDGITPPAGTSKLVMTGGDLSKTDGGDDIKVGTEGGKGIVEQSGYATITLWAGQFMLGTNSGTGTMTMDGGSAVNLYGSWEAFNIGNNGGIGELTMDSTSDIIYSKIFNSNGSIYVGDHGNGKLTMKGYSQVDVGGSLQAGNGSTAGSTILMQDNALLQTGMNSDWSAVAYGGKGDIELRNSAKMDIRGKDGIEIGTGGNSTLKMYNSAKLHVSHAPEQNPETGDWKRPEFRFASSGGAVGTMELHGDSEVIAPVVRIGDWANSSNQLTLKMYDTSRLEADPDQVYPDNVGFMVLGSGDLYMDVTMGVKDGTDTATIKNGWNWFNMGNYGKVSGPGLVMNASTKMILGWEADFGNQNPSDGVLKMELNNDARIDVAGRLKVACDGGHVKITLNNNSAITNQWESEIANRANSHIDLFMNGTSTLELGLAVGTDKQYIAANPDTAIAGSAKIMMTGTSKIFFRSNAEVCIANVGSLDLDMLGGSKMQSFIGGIRIADAGNSSLDVKMTGTSSIISNNFVVLGNNTGTTGTVTLGDLHSPTDEPSITAGAWMNVGCYGARVTLNLNGNSRLTGNAGSTFGSDSGGKAEININDTAELHVNGSIALGDGSGGEAVVTMTGGTISSTSWIAISNSGGCSGEVTMSGNSKITTTSELQVGWGGTGKLHVGGTVSDTSLVQANTIQLGGSGDAHSLIDLNVGGLIETTRIYSSGTPVSSVLNFNGGVLKATANDTATDRFINNNGNSSTFQLNVLAGGANIDMNGHVNSITQPLLGASTTGGLTVSDSSTGTPGSLTLTVAPTYTGNTDVLAGTLTVPSLNTPAATVSVFDGATLNVGSIVADTLVIGGTPGAASPVAVPEPGTFVLLALGGLVALLAWRRK